MHRPLITCAILLFGILPLSSTATHDDWIILFDGDSVDHWRGYRTDAFPDAGWKVENGVLIAIPTGSRVDLITREPYSDFELELEWRVAPGANSGIFYRVSEEAAAIWQLAPEYQVLDDQAGGLKPDHVQSAGALYDLIPPSEDKKLLPVGEFNSTRIVIRGDHIEHWLNGEKILSYNVESADLRERIASSKFGGFERFAKVRNGHIGLQHHGSEVGFRNIRIRRLSESSAESLADEQQ